MGWAEAGNLQHIKKRDPALNVAVRQLKLDKPAAVAVETARLSGTPVQGPAPNEAAEKCVCCIAPMESMRNVNV